MPFIAPDIAIDLGTSQTVVYVKRRGVVLNEPTLVLVSSSNRHAIRAVGDEAGYLYGRTTDALTAIHPLREGVVDDFDSTEAMVRYFIRKSIGASYFSKPRVIISVPVGLPAVNRKAVLEAVKLAGARKVYAVEKPLAAAIGSGLPVYDPVGSMVVDIGGGTTDVAVVSLGGIVVSQSIPVGGARMDEAIVNYLKKNSSMLIGERTAESVKLDLASAIALEDNRKVRIRGRDLLSSHAMDVEFTSAQAHEAMKGPCREILASIRWVLERTPPEIAADIMRTGIHLTGGGANLYGIDQLIGREIGIPVLTARSPEDCTIAGLGHILDTAGLMESLVRIHEN